MYISAQPLKKSEHDFKINYEQAIKVVNFFMSFKLNNTKNVCKNKALILAKEIYCLSCAMCLHNFEIEKSLGRKVKNIPYFLK